MAAVETLEIELDILVRIVWILLIVLGGLLSWVIFRVGRVVARRRRVDEWWPAMS